MITFPLSLLIAHFIGDFLLQSDWMAINKSKQMGALTIHAACYSICFLWCPHPAVFVWFTFVSHLGTDFVTSKITSQLWFLPKVGSGMKANWIQVEVRDTRHWFFVAIGADQLIHAITLALTWSYLGH